MSFTTGAAQAAGRVGPEKFYRLRKLPPEQPGENHDVGRQEQRHQE